MEEPPPLNFVKAGNAVIFLYTRGTCQPYCRSLPENAFLECFEFTHESSIQVRETYSEAVRRAIRDHHAAIERGILLKLHFTIFEYLRMLQMIAVTRSLGPHAMLYHINVIKQYTGKRFWVAGRLLC